ncbi:MAG: NDP-sugar synthase [Candidatus Omnitrophica bacterium]|nr:NDP-sugar synthase [Candidatus Omnitrophota bacterium]MCM8802195.1 NDP-sugar synthase [Candidatus Omnitrophota bacterium]
MKALLLLGGFGTRLRPFTITTPKALLPIVNYPFIAYQFELLRKYGIEEVVLGVGYKGEEFKKAIEIGKKMGIKVYLSYEKKPLGTGGGIKNAEKFLKGKEPFFVFNGDVLADFNLEKILNFHKEKNAYITIGMVKISDPSSYGLILTDDEMRIIKFIEKPKKEEIITDTINAGLYVFQPEVLEEIPKNNEVSIERETFPKILQEGKEMFGYIHYGYWLDVGTIEKFKKGNFDLIDGKIELLYKKSEENLDKKDNVLIGNNVVIEGKLIADENVIIGENSKFKGKVIIGKKSFIGKNCTIENSIIFENVFIGDECFIENSIIGNSVILKNNCEVKNSALGDNSFINQFSKISN